MENYSSRNKDGALARFELSEYPIPFLLLLVSVNSEGGPSILTEVTLRWKYFSEETTMKNWNGSCRVSSSATLRQVQSGESDKRWQR